MRVRVSVFDFVDVSIRWRSRGVADNSDAWLDTLNLIFLRSLHSAENRHSAAASVVGGGCGAPVAGLQRQRRVSAASAVSGKCWALWPGSPVWP